MASWAKQMAPGLMQAAAKARADKLAADAAERQRDVGMGRAIGAAVGGTISAFTPAGPVPGMMIGGEIGGQGGRLKSGQGLGYDDSQQAVQGVSNVVMGSVAAGKAYKQQAGQDRYRTALSTMLRPGNEAALQAYRDMPPGLARKFEAGDIDVFNSWFSGYGVGP